MKILNHYSNYADYLNHQKVKTIDPNNRKIWTTKEWQLKIDWFTELFNQHIDIVKECRDSLCICARMGQEVKTLQNLGLRSIGIDLVPFEPLVIQGDMHSLPFETESVDFVFSNSFDHSLNPDIFVNEIERVLRPGGYSFLILQLGKSGDVYAENDVDSSKEVISLFHNSSVIVDSPLTLSFSWVYNWKVIMKKQ